MYAFVDRPVDGLGNSSRFLVLSMRQWVRAIGQRHCPLAALAPAFSSMGLMDMLPGFHRTMGLLNRDGLDRIAFAPLSYPRVVEDEAVLLALWRDAALGRHDRVRDTLALLVQEGSVRAASTGITGAAGLLKAAHLDPQPLSPDAAKGARP